MQRVGDIPAYQSPWLRPEDLMGRAVPATVERVDVEPIRTRTGETEERLVVTFVGKRKRLILNKTQAAAFVQAAGTDVFADWAGLRVVLVPGRLPNGKATIQVQAAHQDNPFEG